MPYLQVDLDAKKRFPAVARAAGVDVGTVAWGLMELWEYVWSTKKDTVGEMVLSGCFGASQRIIDALVVYDFLERTDDGFRVRGAERYLRVSTASERGRLGGQKTAESGKSKTNLRQFASDVSTEATEATTEATPKQTPKQDRSNTEALTPITNHQSPIKETTLSVVSEKQPDPGERVFEHWRQVMHKNARTAYDKARQNKVNARLSDGYTVEDLILAVDGCAKTPHNMGQNDRGQEYNDLSLICRDAEHVDRFIQNAQAPPIPGQSMRRPRPPPVTSEQRQNHYADFEPIRSQNAG